MEKSESTTKTILKNAMSPHEKSQDDLSSSKAASLKKKVTIRIPDEIEKVKKETPEPPKKVLPPVPGFSKKKKKKAFGGGPKKAPPVSKPDTDEKKKEADTED